VHVDEVTEVRTLDYQTVETPDADALEGQRTVTQKGVEGAQTLTWRVTVTDGVETGREQLSTKTTKKPVDEQVAVGTKPKPKPEPKPEPAAGQAAAPSGGDGLNWAALARCESGGRPNAVSASGTYRGLYQFSKQTWAGVGGSGDPAAASADEQTMRAQMLYARSGAGQWGCGSHLYD
jgi:hypothetical protein